MGKSADAFRTISEVAEWLGIPTHVLRFWESKFSQVKPVKRAGGRRYYRPGDMLLLGGIKKLLHDDGITIKGVQKILRKDGIGHVVQHSQPLDDVTAAEFNEAEFNEIENDITATASKPSPTQISKFKSESPHLPDPTQAEGKPATAPATEATPAVAPEPQVTENEPAVPAHETPALAASEPPPEMPPSQPNPEPSAHPLPAESAPEPEPEPEPAPESEPAPTLAPAQITVPDDPDDNLAAPPGLLHQLARLPRPLTPEIVANLAPVIARLHKISGTGSQAHEN